MIDIRRDKLVPEAEAYRDVLPDAPSPAQRWRWRTKGVMVPQPDGTERRVKLDAVRIGRQVFTTADAVRRFIEAANPNRADAEPADADAIDGRLAAAGVL